jgi:hypothetical protein
LNLPIYYYQHWKIAARDANGEKAAHGYISRIQYGNKNRTKSKYRGGVRLLAMSRKEAGDRNINQDDG